MFYSTLCLKCSWKTWMAYAVTTNAIADTRPPQLQLPKRLDVLRAHHRAKQLQQPSVRASEVAQETSLMRSLHGAFLTALPMPPVVLAAAAAAGVSQPHAITVEQSRSLTAAASLQNAISRPMLTTPTASRKRRSLSPAAAALPVVPQVSVGVAVARTPHVSSLRAAQISGVPAPVPVQNTSALSSQSYLAKRPLFESQPHASFPFAVSCTLFLCAFVHVVPYSCHKLPYSRVFYIIVPVTLTLHVCCSLFERRGQRVLRCLCSLSCSTGSRPAARSRCRQRQSGLFTLHPLLPFRARASARSGTLRCRLNCSLRRRRRLRWHRTRCPSRLCLSARSAWSRRRSHRNCTRARVRVRCRRSVWRPNSRSTPTCDRSPKWCSRSISSSSRPRRLRSISISNTSCSSSSSSRCNSNPIWCRRSPCQRSRSRSPPILKPTRRPLIFIRIDSMVFLLIP